MGEKLLKTTQKPETSVNVLSHVSIFSKIIAQAESEELPRYTMTNSLRA